MIKYALLSVLLLLPAATVSETVVATHAIRAQSIISAADLAVIADTTIGAVTDPSSIVGLEARVTLYPGRAIHMSDVGRPAILERNQIVVMMYSVGALAITAEGRVLDRAGVGERVRVMNMDSRVTVMGLVLPNGTIEVGS